MNSQTIAELGENESLKRVVARLNSSEFAIVGSGDDAAVVTAPDGRFVVTTDTMIEGHDFRLDWSTAFDLGFKAAATNLSDVAAMGAVPTSLVVSLAVPSSTTIDWLEGFADGLTAACQQLSPGCGVVGGDLASADQVFISVTAHGSLQAREPVLRSGAKPGDIVAIGGTLGQAAAGLALLQSGNADAVSAYDLLVNVQRRPQPPISQGPIAAIAGATSMLDVSDGLAKDATRIADASGVTIAFDSLNLQGFEAVVEQAAQAIEASPKDWVLFGGEDHSLLATYGPDAVIPRSFKPIGRVVERGAHALTLDGKPLDAGGWDSVTAK